jgi:hypothetical protein
MHCWLVGLDKFEVVLVTTEELPTLVVLRNNNILILKINTSIKCRFYF